MLLICIICIGKSVQTNDPLGLLQVCNKNKNKKNKEIPQYVIRRGVPVTYDLLSLLFLNVCAHAHASELIFGSGDLYFGAPMDACTQEGRVAAWHYVC